MKRCNLLSLSGFFSWSVFPNLGQQLIDQEPSEKKKKSKKPFPLNFLHLEDHALSPFRIKLLRQSPALCPKGQLRDPLQQKRGSKFEGWGLSTSATSPLLTAGNPRGGLLGLQALPRGNSWSNFKAVAHIPWQSKAQTLRARRNCREPPVSLLLQRRPAKPANLAPCCKQASVAALCCS